MFPGNVDLIRFRNRERETIGHWRGNCIDGGRRSFGHLGIFAWLTFKSERTPALCFALSLNLGNYFVTKLEVVRCLDQVLIVHDAASLVALVSTQVIRVIISFVTCLYHQVVTSGVNGGIPAEGD